MIDNFALSIGSTGSWTGVSTLLLDTGLGQRTLRAQETLGSAVWWASEISLEAGADWPRALWPAFTVGTTGIWVTRI
jgi:hypothetical protein